MGFFDGGFGSAVGALAGGLSSIGAKKRQKDLMDYQAQLQYDYGEKAAENAYQRQMDAWNKQNEYNTPEAQRQRLEDAGMLGASLFSGASAGEASQLPSVGMGATGSGASLQLQSNPVMSNILQGIQVAQSLANLDLTKSNIKNKNAQTESEGYRQKAMQSDIALKEVYTKHEGIKMSVTKINEEIQMATKQAQIDSAWFATEQGRLSIKTSEQNLKNLAEQYQALQNKNELFGIEKQQAILQLGQMAQQIALNKALERFYDARTDLTNWEKQEIAAKIQEIFSNIDLNCSRTSLNYQSVTESAARTARIKSEKEFIDIQGGVFTTNVVMGWINTSLRTVWNVIENFVPAGKGAKAVKGFRK